MRQRDLMGIRTLLDEKAEGLSDRLSEVLNRIQTIEARGDRVTMPASGQIGRGIRSQATNLLRSGMSRTTVARNLGLGAKEIDLIAAVSEALSLPEITRSSGMLKE